MMMRPAMTGLPFSFSVQKAAAEGARTFALYIVSIVKRLRAKVKENVFLCKITQTHRYGFT